MYKFLLLLFAYLSFSVHVFADSHITYLSSAFMAMADNPNDPTKNTKNAGIAQKIKIKEKELRLEQAKKEKLEQRKKTTIKKVSSKDKEIRIEHAKLKQQEATVKKLLAVEEKEIQREKASLKKLDQQQRASEKKISAKVKVLDFERGKEEPDKAEIQKLQKEIQKERATASKLAKQKKARETKVLNLRKRLQGEESKLKKQQKVTLKRISRMEEELQIQNKNLKNLEKLETAVAKNIAQKIQDLQYLSDRYGSYGGGTNGPNTSIPIDGGLSFLVLGGLGFGAYQMKKSKS